jgi:restriction system protein
VSSPVDRRDDVEAGPPVLSALIKTSAAAVLGATALTAVAPALAWLWWLAAAAALAAALWSRPIARGRLAAAAERERRAGILEAERHRELASLDAMTGPRFERHVAHLCLRDGLTVLQAGGGRGDLGADVIATLPDERRVVIQCKRYKPASAVSGPEMQQFLGTVRAEHGADVALFVTTARRFTRQAQDLAHRHDVHLVHRDRLAFWNSGTPLPALLATWERG